MLNFDRQGAGPPLVLLHGTNSSREVWGAVVPQLAKERDVIVVDLPAHGGSAPTSYAPPGFARDVAELLDALKLSAPTVVGHSIGGWTALELAKLGRSGAVLALAPAGLWRRRSPRLSDLSLQVSWRLGRLPEALVDRSLRTRAGRARSLRSVSADPGAVSYSVALASARAARASLHFPEHFKQTRGLRFTGGTTISPDILIRIVWGGQDYIALARRSRFVDELPAHARVETWDRCGHMVMWDQDEQLVRAALEVSAARNEQQP